MVTMRPTDKELKLVQPFIEEFGEPNIIFNVYKNRDGEIPMFKVFGRLDLGTFEFEELFVTDWMFRPFKYVKVSKVNLVATVEVDKETGEIVDTETEKQKSRRR